MNYFNITRRYFEIKTAYNIDKFYFQSLVSTAVKLGILGRTLARGEDLKSIHPTPTMSMYWVNAVLRSSLFSEQRQVLKRTVEQLRQTDGILTDSTENDDYCRYVLIQPIGSRQKQIMDLSTGEYQLANVQHSGRGARCNLITLGKQQLPIYDFTRFECGESVSIVSGCYPVT